jgi:hypothetical protein
MIEDQESVGKFRRMDWTPVFPRTRAIPSDLLDDRPVSIGEIRSALTETREQKTAVLQRKYGGESSDRAR